MKKFLSVLLLVAGIALSSTAQRFQTFPLVAGDTLVMSTSADTVYKVITATAGYSAFAIKVKLTELSGTTACKAYLHSGDGTDYTLTDSAAVFTDQVTNIAWFTKTTTPYTHYKVEVRPVGLGVATFSGIVRISYVLKRHD
jgi:hypothetical protein